jgi:hypothetical protein
MPTHPDREAWSVLSSVRSILPSSPTGPCLHQCLGDSVSVPRLCSDSLDLVAELLQLGYDPLAPVALNADGTFSASLPPSPAVPTPPSSSATPTSTWVPPLTCPEESGRSRVSTPHTEGEKIGSLLHVKPWHGAQARPNLNRWSHSGRPRRRRPGSTCRRTRLLRLSRSPAGELRRSGRPSPPSPKTTCPTSTRRCRPMMETVGERGSWMVTI